MWIFTKYGFYSAVCARQGEGHHGMPVDTKRMMIRARLREHLDALKDRFPQRLNECPICEFPHSDYAFRLFVAKETWLQVLAGLAEEIDYDNFKNAVARHQGASGAAYGHALHEVWSAMFDLQT